jgi:hypothetical protein
MIRGVMAKAASKARQVQLCALALALPMLGACTRHVVNPVDIGDDDSSSIPVVDSSVVSVVDASAAESSVLDRGSGGDPFGPFDRATRERPPAKDTGSGVGNNDNDAPNATDVPNGVDASQDSRADDANITPEIDSGPLTTESILAAQGSDCLACANENGCLDPMQLGGTCEMVAGQAHSGGLSETAMCLKVLKKIITSKCTITVNPTTHNIETFLTPCVCGTADNSQCMAGTVVPNGPIYEECIDDFGDNTPAIFANFVNQMFGVGMAGAAIQCVEAFATTDPRCFTCIGLSPDAGAN